MLLTASAITLLMLGAFVLAMTSHFWLAAIVAVLALGAGLLANPLVLARGGRHDRSDGRGSEHPHDDRDV